METQKRYKLDPAKLKRRPKDEFQLEAERLTTIFDIHSQCIEVCPRYKKNECNGCMFYEESKDTFIA